MKIIIFQLNSAWMKHWSLLVYKFALAVWSVCTVVYLVVITSTVTNLENHSNTNESLRPIALSQFVKYYYYPPLADDPNDIFRLFEECPIYSWSKNSPEHYFMTQLQMNRNGNRVWDCNSAEMVVIPISLGNWRRNQCGFESAEWQSDDELPRAQNTRNVIERINQRVFEDESSCWNIAPETRPFHLLLIGDYDGRMVVRNHVTAGRLWITNRLIVADSHSGNSLWFQSVPLLTVSHGFTSIASKQLTFHRLMTNNAFNQLTIHSVNDGKLGPNQLPEVSIVSDFNEWKHRKFNLFLMGQAADREAYSLRQMALKKLSPDHNVLIQTGNPDEYRFTECRNATDTGDFLFFPCSMEPSERLYVDYLMRSRFNLMFRGDDPCSSRFYDALALNTINIVISDGFHSGCIIGGGLMTDRQRNMLFLTVNESEFTADPTHSIQREIDKYDDSYFERMLIEIEKWKPYLLWDSYRSETAETLLLEAFTKKKAMESEMNKN